MPALVPHAPSTVEDGMPRDVVSGAAQTHTPPSRDDGCFSDFTPPTNWRVAVAGAIDTVMVLGWPFLLVAPAAGSLVVTAIWVIPLFAMAVIGWVLMSRARRQPNGDRLSAGLLLTGLTVVRTSTRHRVVVAAEAEPALRPSVRRVAAGWVAFSLAALAVVGIWGTAGFVYVAARQVSESRADGGVAPEWQAREPEARSVCDAFISDLLSSNPRGGERFVSGRAATALPEYRKRIRREGVTAFAQNGSGMGDNEWEYMFVEQNPVQAGSHWQRSVSIQVTLVDGRMLVTQIAPSEMYSDDAFDAPAEAATETAAP